MEERKFTPPPSPVPWLRRPGASILLSSTVQLPDVKVSEIPFSPLYSTLTPAQAVAGPVYFRWPLKEHTLCLLQERLNCILHNTKAYVLREFLLPDALAQWDCDLRSFVEECACYIAVSLLRPSLGYNQSAASNGVLDYSFRAVSKLDFQD